jgi:hypothetical protein
LHRSADLAVFRVMPPTTEEKGNPPHSVDWKDLGSIYTGETPNQTDTATADDNISYKDISYKHLFAAYYPSSRLTVKQTSMSQGRKQSAEAAGVDDAWQWIGLESEQAHRHKQPPVILSIQTTQLDQ